MYDPRTARFLSPDPAGYAADLNLYRYCRNDPVNRADPSGKGSVFMSAAPGRSTRADPVLLAEYLYHKYGLRVHIGLYDLGPQPLTIDPTPEQLLSTFDGDRHYSLYIDSGERAGSGKPTMKELLAEAIGKAVADDIPLLEALQEGGSDVTVGLTADRRHYTTWFPSARRVRDRLTDTQRRLGPLPFLPQEIGWDREGFYKALAPIIVGEPFIRGWATESRSTPGAATRPAQPAPAKAAPRYLPPPTDPWEPHVVITPEGRRHVFGSRWEAELAAKIAHGEYKNRMGHQIDDTLGIITRGVGNYVIAPVVEPGLMAGDTVGALGILALDRTGLDPIEAGFRPQYLSETANRAQAISEGRKDRRTGLQGTDAMTALYAESLVINSLPAIGLYGMKAMIRSGERAAMRAVTEDITGSTASSASGPRPAIYTATEDIDKILASGRVWGQTEGSVYGMTMRDAPRWRSMANPKTRDPGLVVFEDEAAALFKPHPIEGPYSGLKRALGQYKAPFGDIQFDPSKVVIRKLPDGRTEIIIREATIGLHAGQSEMWAASRLWGRRLTIEPIASATAAAGAYYTYRIIIDE